MENLWIFEAYVRFAQEVQADREEDLRKKKEAAEAIADSYRQQGVSEEEIKHILVLRGYGGLC